MFKVKNRQDDTKPIDFSILKLLKYMTSFIYNTKTALIFSLNSFQVTSKRQYDNVEEFVGLMKSTGTLQEYTQQFPEEGDQIERFKKKQVFILS